MSNRMIQPAPPRFEDQGDAHAMEDVATLSDDDHTSGTNVSASKPTRNYTDRAKIAVACSACQKRKSKCNGDRPKCTLCIRRGSPCSYVDAETRSRVRLAERIQELTASIGQHETFVTLLCESDDGTVRLMITELRSSGSVEAAIKAGGQRAEDDEREQEQQHQYPMSQPSPVEPLHVLADIMTAYGRGHGHPQQTVSLASSSSRLGSSSSSHEHQWTRNTDAARYRPPSKEITLPPLSVMLSGEEAGLTT
ncbi:hypothetical protein MMC25_001388 [Agyrium rufum]|nr:hypothetical protein [Agyrium rufum]